MINSVCGIRSTGRICTDLAETLIDNGHQCEIAYGRETVPEKYSNISYRICSECGVMMHALASRIFDCSGFCGKKPAEKLICEIERFNPDVIHLHNLHGYYLDIETLFEYLASADIPVVWTLHDCWAFTGHCAYFAAAKCERWRDGCHNCPQKSTYPASVVFDRSKYNYERKKRLFTSVSNMTLVTPSDWLAGLVRDSYLKKYPVQVIRNGIDLSVFKPTAGDFRKRYGIGNKKVILGVASVWSERKGLNDFIALSELVDKQTCIVLVGVNKKQQKMLPENIIGIERTSNVRELAEIYTAADVFVNPTYEDNYPTVNLEAQACGTPVITYRTGGSVESVCDDAVVEQGNVEQLNKALSENICIKSDLVLDMRCQTKDYLRLFNNIVLN